MLHINPNSVIPKKSLLVLLFIQALLIALVAAVFIHQEIKTIKRATIQNFKTIARIVGEHAQEMLLFKDQRYLQVMINGLKAQQQIIYVGIYDEDGQLLAYFIDEHIKQAMPVVSYANRNRLTEDYLEVAHPITSNQKVIGWLYLRFALHALNTQVIQTLYFSVLLLLVLLMSSWISLKFVAP